MLNAHGRAMDVPSVPQCAAVCRNVPQCAQRGVLREDFFGIKRGSNADLTRDVRGMYAGCTRDVRGMRVGVYAGYRGISWDRVGMSWDRVVVREWGPSGPTILRPHQYVPLTGLTRHRALAFSQRVPTPESTFAIYTKSSIRTHIHAIAGSPTLEYVAPEGVALHDSRKAAHSIAASCACAHSAARSGVLYTDGTQDRSGSMIDILGLGYSNSLRPKASSDHFGRYAAGRRLPMA